MILRLAKRPKHWTAFALCFIGTTAFAQSTTNGSDLTLSFGVVLDDDPTVFTAADLSIKRATRTQTFSFDASSGLAMDRDFTVTATDPKYALSYTNVGSPVLFQANYRYSKDDVDGASGIDGSASAEQVLIVDQGTRAVTSANLNFEVGARDPIGAQLSLDYGLIDYDGTTDDRLYDRETRTAKLDLRFHISPVIDAIASLERQTVDGSDRARTYFERTTTTLGFVLDYNPVTTVTGSVSQVNYVAESNIVSFLRRRDESDNLGFQLGVEIDRPTGSMALRYEREIDAGRPLDRLFYSHTLALSEIQRLSYSLGAARDEGDDTHVIGSLSYNQTLRNGGFTLAASQDAIYSDLGNAAVTRQLQARYSTDLTAQSSLSATASYGSIDYVSGSLSDVETFELGLSYSHQLTRDWTVDTRAARRWSLDRDNRSESSTLSIALSREYSLFR